MYKFVKECESGLSLNGFHCWHNAGRMKLVSPPIVVEICCFCGKERDKPRVVVDSGITHGPHDPERRWHQLGGRNGQDTSN